MPTGHFHKTMRIFFLFLLFLLFQIHIFGCSSAGLISDISLGIAGNYSLKDSNCNENIDAFNIMENNKIVTLKILNAGNGTNIKTGDHFQVISTTVSGRAAIVTVGCSGSIMDQYNADTYSKLHNLNIKEGDLKFVCQYDLKQGLCDSIYTRKIQ